MNVIIILEIHVRAVIFYLRDTITIVQDQIFNTNRKKLYKGVGAR